MKILVCEDNFVDRKILCNFLQKYGMVDVAMDGQEAVEAFVAGLTENKPYSLICLDITMPKLNGHETLQAIRHYEEEACITAANRSLIIMTTSLDDPASILKSFKDQCDGYLKKPITRNLLHTELAKLNIRLLNDN